MRLMNITCILLATTICCVAAQAAVTGKEDKNASQQPPDITAVNPKNPPSIEPVISQATDTTKNTSTNSTSTGGTGNSTSDAGNSTGTTNSTKDIVPPNTNVPSVVTPTILPVTSDSVKPTNTSGSIKPENTSQPILPITEKTVTIPITPITEATSSKKPPTTIPNNASSAVPSPATTAVPVSTNVAPPSPSKERHFDGLSFLGGIILATSLMAIGVLSWKFYRTFNERNYRTL